MRLLIAAALAATAVAVPALAQTACPVNAGTCGFTTGPGSMVQATNSSVRRFQRIVNSSSTGTLWCTRDPAATPAPNGSGSYPIAAGQPEEFSTGRTGYVPPYPTRCVGDTAGMTGSVEVN